MTSLSWQRLVAAAIFIAFITQVIAQLAIIGPSFDSLTYGYLSKLFISNLITPISLPELNLLVVTPTTGPLFIPTFSLFFSFTDYSFNSLNICILLLNSALLAILLWRLQRVYPDSWQGSMLIIASCLILWLQDTRWFLFALGDVPALLLTFIAVTFALDSSYSLAKRHQYFTLLASLALLTRLTALPLVAGAAIYLVGYSWQALPPQRRVLQLIKLCAGNGCIVIGCTSFAFMLQYLSLRIDSIILYQELLQVHREFLATNATANFFQENSLANNLTIIKQSAEKNYLMLVHYLEDRVGFNLTALSLLILVPLCLLITQIKNMRQHPLAHIFGMCCAMFALQAIWFFTAAELMYSRYTFQLVTALLLACSIGLIIIHRYAFLCCVIVLLAALAITRPSMTSELPFTAGFQQEQQKSSQLLQEMREVQSFIEAQPQESFSYLKFHGASLSLTLNFFINDEKQIQGIEALLNRDIKQHNTVNNDYLLVIEKPLWHVIKFKPQNLQFQNRLHRACPEEVFANRVYRVMLCKAENLNRQFPADEVRAWQLPSFAW